MPAAGRLLGPIMEVGAVSSLWKVLDSVVMEHCRLGMVAVLSLSSSSSRMVAVHRVLGWSGGSWGTTERVWAARDNLLLMSLAGKTVMRSMMARGRATKKEVEHMIGG